MGNIIMGIVKDLLKFLIPTIWKRWEFYKNEEAHEKKSFNDEYAHLKFSLLNLNDAKKYEGKVKKITRYYTDIKEETVTKAGICYVINYNKNRKTEDLLEFDRKGKEIKHLIYEYDKNGNLIFVKNLNKKGEKGVVDCYIYNDKGQHVETKYFDDGQIDYDTCYKYDENGNCIEVNTDDYRLDGIVVESRYVSVYDENNREIERIKYEGLTGETEKEVYFYNKNGDLKEIQNIDIETGEIISRDLYCYDTDGKLSEILTYEGSDVMGKWTYSYNQQGKETECRIYDGFGNLTHKHVSLYDKRGSFCGTKKYKNGILIFSYLDEIEYYD